MKKIVAFSVLIALLLFLCACSSRSALSSTEEQSRSTETSLMPESTESEIIPNTTVSSVPEENTTKAIDTSDPVLEQLDEYPISISNKYIKQAQELPEITYRTTGEENGLGDSIFWVTGTVDDVFDVETDSGMQIHCFTLKTNLGTVLFQDYYSLLMDYGGSEMSAYKEAGADYSFPSIGQTVKVYGYYQGFSGVYDAPALVYGCPEAYTFLLDDDGPSNENETTAPTEKSLTTGQKNALSTANSYLSYSAFSYSGLIDQLEYEGYTKDEATFAADNCGADWKEQALKSALSYLDYSSFSYTGLVDQLEYEGFTTEEATYAVDHCGADWFEQAAKCAESYLNYSSFSRNSLISQLEYEGFTHEQAVYGAEKNGY